ncbi:MAG: AMP-binding protein, partial [Planctomycetes bacterium]|nr:AMP-binding protein [Planctomycetota bacterium]
RDIADYDLSSLVFCISGGAPLAVEIHRRFEERTGCILVEGYGLSETGPVCTVNPINDGRRPGSAGLPLPATVIEITALDNPDCVLALGDRGEVCVSGPQVMAGYANRAKENIDVFRGGRLHTGDIGYLDDDGYLFVVDRIKDLILSGGFNVYPRMVEEVIHLHPAVEEVAVCGVPDRHRGEIVKAFVKLGDGEELTAGDLRVFLKDKLAPFQMPRKIEFRDSLPKTLIGKISKKDLIAEDAAGRLEAATKQLRATETAILAAQRDDSPYGRARAAVRRTAIELKTAEQRLLASSEYRRRRAAVDAGSARPIELLQLRRSLLEGDAAYRRIKARLAQRKQQLDDARAKQFQSSLAWQAATEQMAQARQAKSTSRLSLTRSRRDRTRAEADLRRSQDSAAAEQQTIARESRRATSLGLADQEHAALQRRILSGR